MNIPPLTRFEIQRAHNLVGMLKKGILKEKELYQNEKDLIERVAREAPDGATGENFSLDLETPMGNHNYSQDSWRYRSPATGTYHDARSNTGLKGGLVHVQKKDGTILPFRVGDNDAWWFRNACWAWRDNVTKVGDDTIVTIPEEKAHIDYNQPAFSSCTFDSVSDYLKGNFGKWLHYTDKDWLSKHPYAEEMGVPQEYTPTAIQELVEPYGLGISRIRIVKDGFFMGEALEQWILALGCNPPAQLDHATTNAEAAKLMGMSEADANALWRFEFSEVPLWPAVIGERMPATPAVNGKRGGHASYLAPRGYYGEWFLSYQLAPLKDMVYYQPIVYPEYKPRAGTMRLSLVKTKGPNDRDLDYREWYDEWVRAGSPGKALPPGIEIVHGAASGDSSSSDSGAKGKSKGKKGKGKGKKEKTPVLFEFTSFLVDPNDTLALMDEIGYEAVHQGLATNYCTVCKKVRSEDLMLDEDVGVCIYCYYQAWKEYHCSKGSCQLRFGWEVGKLPVVTHIDDAQDVHFGCPRCGQDFVANQKDIDQRELDSALWMSFDGELEAVHMNPPEHHADSHSALEGPIH